MIEKLKITKYAEWLVRHKYLVIFITVTLAFVAISGARFIKVNNDYHVYFGPENPQLKAFDELQAKYTKDDNVFIVIEPTDGNIFTKESLSAIDELVDEAWKTPYSTRVDAITNFQHIYSKENDMYVEDLVAELDFSKSQLEKVKQVALNDPLLLNRLINSNGSLTAVNITVNLPGKELTENGEVANHVDRVVKNWEEKHPGLNTYLTGNVMFNNAFDASFEDDMMTLTPLMFLVIIIVLLLSTRNITATISTFIIVLLSMGTAMGLAGWFGIQLSGPVFSAPNMILTLAIADSIHILVTILQQMRLNMSKKEAIIESLQINFLPVLITSTTTVIGFLTLNFSDTPPFQDLGNITAMGVVAAFVYSISLLPALMYVLPVKVKPSKSNETLPLLEKYGRWMIPRYKPLLLISSILVIGIFSFSVNNELNNDFIKFFDDTVKFRNDSDFIDENMTGMYTIEFSIPAQSSDGISDPVYLNKLSEFELWFENQPNVVHVSSFSEIIRRINRSMHGDDQNHYQIPQSKQEAAQFLLLYEMSLPYGLDLNNQINVDKSETRFVATIKNITSQELIDLTSDAEGWLKNNAPEHMFSHGISMPLMFSHITKRNMSSMIQGGLVALVLISLILIIALRSIRYGLISLIPNLTPIAVAFGVWGLIDGQIDMGISIVFGMTLGLVVDDTVHLLAKYLRARREQGKSPEEAIQYAFSHVGKAVITTTIVLTAGFMVLAQSHFGFNAGMAKVSALTIVIALILDMVLLPSVLLMVDKKKADTSDTTQSHKIDKQPEIIA